MKRTELKQKDKKIPLLDLKTQYRSIKKEIDKAIQRVVDEQNFIMGKDVTLLEEEIASYCGAKFGIGVSSGTEALFLALKTIGVKEGDEVITTPFTFMATGSAISNAGGRPVFCDINPKTYNIDPNGIKNKISKKTKAIMPVHLYGQCADMDEILEIANANGIKVIEDAAQAIGATYKKKKASSMGDIGCISFFPSKNLGAFGDAGMVITNDENIAEKIKLLRVHGSKKQYVHSVIGTNARLDNLQAAILRVKLKYLDSWTKKRQKNAQNYDKILNGTLATPPYVASYNTHVYHQYVIKVPKAKRGGLVQYLSEFNIGSRAYYPIPLHLQECYRFLRYKKGDFPHSEEAANSTLAIPIYAELEAEDINYIGTSIKSYLSA